MSSQSHSPHPRFCLDGNVIVLTGGVGLYGRGLAIDLARAGATVVIASRNIEALNSFATAQRGDGLRIFSHSLDLGLEASIVALRDYVIRQFGAVDGLVNNAVGRPMTSLHAPLADWSASMHINATGLFAISRCFGEAMIARNKGAIVNISSIQGIVGPHLALYKGTAIQTLPDYFFHKAGMVNLTRYFAAVYGPYSVRVNCISPGGYFNGQDDAFVRRYSDETFLRRMANDDDLGGPVIFLLSEAAKYVTGVNLPVDGGYTAH